MTPPEPHLEEDEGFDVGPGVQRAARAHAYDRKPGDPPFRRLRIYAMDPAASTLEGAVATVKVPYEALSPGPCGAALEVMPLDASSDTVYRRVCLDDPEVLIRDGRDPSPSDPRFHQQMVYAVGSGVVGAFRRALGRHVAWGFDGRSGPLRLFPHGTRERNAFYDKSSGEIRFGYFRADRQVHGRSLPEGYVFTCLSHDIVAHEVTHALLDGLRSHFTYPSGPDVLGFHEGFADLVAVLQHFTYDALLQQAMRQCRGRVEQAALLTGLATQFGHTTGSAAPLRTAIRVDAEGRVVPEPYDPQAEAHALGSVLVSAAFEAFATRFARKTERLVALATGGSGVLPEGEMPPALREMLAEEAASLAGRFLQICIRAIDYCPPVDLELGEYLRALLTADHDLVPADRWGFREAWIDAFARRGIYPERVTSLAEDVLRWQAPERDLVIPELHFANLRFRGDPANPAGPAELDRQARALGRVVRLHLDQFGMAPPDHPRLHGDRVDRPVVQSIRSSRRVGPHGEVVFDLVAEVTQRRRVRHLGEEFDFFGGATVILGPQGEVRYTIAKNVLNERRIERQLRFMRATRDRYWEARGAAWAPKPQLFRYLHREALEEPASG